MGGLLVLHDEPGQDRECDKGRRKCDGTWREGQVATSCRGAVVKNRGGTESSRRCALSL